MMKKYFTDGLIQLAIVLSLLRSRTDLNDYLNNLVNDFSRERSQVHEIILGSGTSAFTQTDHHTDWFSDISTNVHPKNIDNYISSSVFRDLHALGADQTFVYTNIDAYLVGESTISSESPSSGSTESIGSSSSNNNNINSTVVVNNVSNNTGDASNTTDNDDTESTQSIDTFSTESSLTGSELTVEDMDLIEILWRQDIDIGVSKDAFNATIRKELEKDETLELLKEKEVAKKEQEETTSFDNENNGNTGDSTITYIIDVETGELVPAPPGTVIPDETNTPHSMDVEAPQQNEETMPISFEEAIEILERECQNGSTNSVNSSVSTVNNLDNPLQSDIDTLVQNISQLARPSFSSQASMEARWNDVSRLITNTNDSEDNNNSGVHNILLTQNHSMEVNDTLENTGLNTALLHNASLGAGEAVQDASFNLTQALAISNDLPITLNESQSLFNTSASDDLLNSLFPNASVVQLNSSSSDNLLQSLLNSVGNDLTGPLSETDIIKIEDGDSAVGSMGSDGETSNLQDFGDSHSNLTSPFDGLEGATGGPETNSHKVAKYDPNGSRFSFSTIEWNITDFHKTNSSGDDSSTSLSYKDPAIANPQNVAHNHSYPLKPGQESREEKKQKELEKKITRSRDERKAKAMKLPISVEDIIHTPVEKFTDLMSKFRLTEGQMQLVKDIRRRGKNKVAAQNCRKRKMEVIETLEESVNRMRKEREDFAREKMQLQRQRDKIREKYSGLYRDVFRSLRDEHGHPYDPNQYTLQHTADGNVFLVPKTNTTSDEPNLKDTKKRKDRK